MTKFIKILLYMLCIALVVSGLILSIPCIDKFYKIVSENTLSIDETDISKFNEDTLISGNIQYVIDCVAISNVEEASNTDMQYFLVPIKSQKYIIVATQQLEIVNSFENIQEQTKRFLNDEIDDTTISIYIEGSLIPLDEELSKILYEWNVNNTFDISIDGEILSYIIYVHNWSTIKVFTIIGLFMSFTGVIGIFIIIIKIKNIKN